MLKTELIQRVAGMNPHLRLREAEKIVNTIFGEMIAAMTRGDRVELRGIGIFTVRVRPRSTGPKSKDRGRSRRAGETCSPFQARQANARTPEWRLGRVTLPTTATSTRSRSGRGTELGSTPPRLAASAALNTARSQGSASRRTRPSAKCPNFKPCAPDSARTRFLRYVVFGTTRAQALGWLPQATDRRRNSVGLRVIGIL